MGMCTVALRSAGKSEQDVFVPRTNTGCWLLGHASCLLASPLPDTALLRRTRLTTYARVASRPLGLESCYANVVHWTVPDMYVFTPAAFTATGTPSVSGVSHLGCWSWMRHDTVSEK